MHRCLTINELLTIIFENMDTGIPSSLKIFADLGVTCRNFREPALDKLWSTQVTLAPLIRTMPEDLLGQHEDGSIIFRRPLLATDWARFEYYERRIKQLGHYYFPHRPLETTPIHPDVFIALTDYRPVRTFLHNLKVLKLDDHHVGMFPFIQGFIGPNLVSVCVFDSCSFDDHHMVSFISALPHLSPNIQDIESTGSYDAVLEAWSQVIGTLQHLRDIDIEYVIPSEETMNHISRLPFLSKLAIVKLTPENLPLFTTKNGGFRKLEKFAFCADLLDAERVLDAMRCRLTFMFIGIELNDDIDHVTQLSHLVRNNNLLARHHGGSLTQLFIELDAIESDAVDDDFLPSPVEVAQAFLPLLSIRCLEIVCLTTPLVHYLDDTWLEHAAQAWPHIWSLTLKGGYSASTTRFTLGGLLPLLRYCPNLISIELCFHIKPFYRSSLEGIDNNCEVLSNSSKPCIPEDSIVEPDLIAQWMQGMFRGLFGIRGDS